MTSRPLRSFLATFQTRSAILFAALLVTLALPQRALAHAYLAQSSPAAGARLAAGPRTLTLQFTEAVAPASRSDITVWTVGGHAVRLGPIRRVAGNTTLTAAMPRLASDVYVVRWREVAADDGHPSSGEFAFAVGTDAPLPIQTNSVSTPTAWWDALATWLFLLGLAVTVGGLASELIIWAPLVREQIFWAPLAREQPWTMPLTPVRGALLTAMFGGASVFILLAGSVTGGGALTGLDPHTWSAALHVQAGLLAFVGLIFVLLALVALLMGRARVWALNAATFATVAAALRSHPATTHPWWAVVAIEIHMVVALVWVGLLAHLVLVLRRGRDRISDQIVNRVVRRYARVALGSVLLVLASGLVVALAEFHTLNQVPGTWYGRVLLAKTALVALALLLALASRLRGMRRPADTSLVLVRRLTRIEILTLAAVLGAAAALGSVAPPATPPNGADMAALMDAPATVGPAVHLASQAGWLEVYVTASTGQLTIVVRAPGDQSTRLGRLALTAISPTRRPIGLAPGSCGPGCVTMRLAWQRGVTSLHMQVGTDTWGGGSATWGGGSATFAVPWPPAARNPAFLARALAAMRAEPILMVHERVTSGPRASAQSTTRITGPRFLASEPYGAGRVDVRGFPDHGGAPQLILYLPGSYIWVHIWFDAQHRYQRETIIAPGYLIERTFSYSG